jgi:hypothetical protein
MRRRGGGRHCRQCTAVVGDAASLIPTAAGRVPAAGTGTDLALRVDVRSESHELGGSVGMAVDRRLVQGVLLALRHT